MKDILVFATVIAPVILGLVEVFKRTLNVNKRFTPLVAIVVGVTVGILGGAFMNGVVEIGIESRAWAGVLSGLSAVGLFEMVKTTSKSKEEQR